MKISYEKQSFIERYQEKIKEIFDKDLISPKLVEKILPHIKKLIDAKAYYLLAQIPHFFIYVFLYFAKCYPNCDADDITRKINEIYDETIKYVQH